MSSALALNDPQELVAVAKAEAQAAQQQDLQLAVMLHGTGLYPRFKSPAECVAALAAGRQLGLSPHASLSRLYVVQGQVSLQSEAMLATILASGKVRVTYPERCVESGKERVTVRMERIDGTGEAEVTWDAARAKATGNAGKHSSHYIEWLTWRAVAECARIVAADVIAGVYTDDELRDAHPTWQPSVTVHPVVREALAAAHPEAVPDAPAVIGRAGAKALRGQVADLARDRGIAQKVLSAEFERLVADADVRNADYLTHAQADDIADKLRVIASDIAEEAAQAEPDLEPEVATDDDPFGGE